MSGIAVKWVTAAAAAIALLSFGASASAQSAADTFPVYPGVAPGTESWKQHEQSMQITDPRHTNLPADTMVWDVTRPVLTVYRPPAGTSNGAAVIVAPGGGFRVLSYANEGTRVAAWLNAHGITAFVLKYRLHEMPEQSSAVMQMFADMGARMNAAAGAPGPAMPPMQIGEVERGGISDGEHAVALVRQRAAEFGIDPHRIGIIGFSAGGLVSSGTAILGQGASRPDFVGIIYSDYPDAIPATAPPAFMAAAADDPLSRRMPDLFNRWRAAGVSAELHVYAEGQHGFGMYHQGLPVDGWIDAFYGWMGQQHLLTAQH